MTQQEQIKKCRELTEEIIKTQLRFDISEVRKQSLIIELGNKRDEIMNSSVTG